VEGGAVSINLDDLERLAKAATPGPWENRSGFVRSSGGGSIYVGDDVTITTSCDWVAECRDGEAFYNWQANAAFIAAANPAVVLELIRLARAANEYFGEKRP
jgi:hypothetical protein